jgi:NAD(P)-dependent dehydrogenase (short-subunit alcohol dehydrogenase family)
MKQAMCAYVPRQAHPMFKRGIRINAICPGPTDTPQFLPGRSGTS